MGHLCRVLALLLLAAPAWGGAAPPLPIGAQFQVNTYTTNGQFRPSVALSAGGDFVVVWDNDGSSGDDTGSFSIQGQRFRVTGDLPGSIFFDANANGPQNARLRCQAILRFQEERLSVKERRRLSRSRKA